MVAVDLIGVDLFHDESILGPVQADPGAVVLSTFTTCGAISGLAASSPFTAIDVGDAGSSIAYDIPSDSGMYAAQWAYDGSPSAAYTVAFQ